MEMDGHVGLNVLKVYGDAEEIYSQSDTTPVITEELTDVQNTL